MPRVQLPETDLVRIERWCTSQVPPDLHDQVRIESHVRGRSVTLCETRPVYLGSPGEWTHMNIAQLRWVAESSTWTLHWSDRNGRWHEYHEGGRFSGTAVQLLSEIDDDPTAIFKG